jgi:hydroxymethylbilane synthase
MAATAMDTSASTQETFHVGTRRSLLARVQTDQIVQALKKHWPTHKFEIHAMATHGDNDATTALYKFNEKSLWTAELEVLLQNKELDFIVHSLKDMPTQLPNDCILGAVTARNDPRDALVVHPSLVSSIRTLADLPEGSVVGTSSLRRIAQLKRHFPKLAFKDVRGNIGTRLAKLDNPDVEYSAIVIAVAGLERLGMQDRITSYLSKDNGGMLHAVGQGALGVESRKDDERTQKLLDPIVCERSMRAALVERGLLRTLEGGCSVPIGVETKWASKKTSLISNAGTGVGVGIKPAEEYNHLTGVAQEPTNSQMGLRTSTNDAARDDSSDGVTDELDVRAIVVSLDGQQAAETSVQRRINSRHEAEEFGIEVARMLVEKGADKILKDITLNRHIIEEQHGA